MPVVQIHVPLDQFGIITLTWPSLRKEKTSQPPSGWSVVSTEAPVLKRRADQDQPKNDKLRDQPKRTKIGISNIRPWKQ